MESAEFHRLAGRLILVRRAISRLEKLEKELAPVVLAQMGVRHAEALVVERGKVQVVESSRTSADPRALYKKFGDPAFDCLSVKTGEATTKFGTDAMKDVLVTTTTKSLRTYPAKAPDRVKVAV